MNQIKLKCSFCDYIPECEKDTCDDCPIRAESIARENETIAENMKDYWRCLNSGAER